MTPEWKDELAKVEVERKQAETRLDNAMRHLAEVQADQIERDTRFRDALLRSISALMEGLREAPKNGEQQEPQ